MKNGDKKPEDILATALFLVVQISLMMDPYIHLEHTDSRWHIRHLKHFLLSVFFSGIFL